MNSNIIHIITSGGTVENGFKPLKFNPVTHAQFLDNIARFRLPPPRFWSVLNTSVEDLANPASRINKTLGKHETVDGDGMDGYLKAALDDLFILEGSLAQFRYIYLVDMAQYPNGYEMILRPDEYVTASTLESLDLISIASGEPARRNSRVYYVTQTPRGNLTFEAIIKTYGLE